MIDGDGSPGGWQMDFEDYDSDGSVHSVKPINDEYEYELAAVNLETGFKKKRAIKMKLDCKAALGKQQPIAVQKQSNFAIKALQDGDKHLSIQKLFMERGFLTALGENKTCFQLTIHEPLTSNQCKGLAAVLRVNTNIRVIKAMKRVQVDADSWEILSDAMEFNYSLLFFDWKDSTKEVLEESLNLEKFRKFLYRNQQICQMAFESSLNSFELGDFSHVKVTLVGSKGSGKSTIAKTLFEDKGSSKPIEVSVYEGHITKEVSGFKWTATDLQRKMSQFSKEYSNRNAVSKINYFLKEVRSRSDQKIDLSCLMQGNESSSLAVNEQFKKSDINILSDGKKKSPGKKIKETKSNHHHNNNKLFGGLGISKFFKFSRNAPEAAPQPVVQVHPQPKRENSGNVSLSSRTEGGTFSVTSSLEPLAGDRSVATSLNPANNHYYLPGLISGQPISVQLASYFTHMDSYNVDDSRNKLFNWSDFYDLLIKPEKTRVSVWDFNKYKAFRASNGIFLNDFGVFIVTVSLRNLANSDTRESEAKEFKFWMESLARCCPNSSVIIAGTFAHEASMICAVADLNLALQNELDEINFPFDIAKDGQNLFFEIYFEGSNDEFKRALSEKCVSLNEKKMQTEQVPGYWFSILDSLKKNVHISCPDNHEITESRYELMTENEIDMRRTYQMDGNVSPKFSCCVCHKPSPLPNEKNPKLFRCLVCDVDMCNKCYAKSMHSCFKSEKYNPGLITVKELHKRCDRFKINVDECKQMLEYFNRERFVLFFDRGSKDNFIFLTGKWLMQRFSEIIIEDDLQGEDFKRTQLQALGKVSLDEDFKQLLREGIASTDLLNHLWGTNLNFFASLLKKYMVLEPWNATDDKHFVIFAMIPPVPPGKNMVEEYLSKDSFYLSKFYTQNDLTSLATGVIEFNIQRAMQKRKVHRSAVCLFERIVCLCVDHFKTLHFATFQQQKTPEPKLLSDFARLYFTPQTPVFLQKLGEKDGKYAVAFSICTGINGAESVPGVLQSVIRKVNQDFFKSALSWQVYYIGAKGKKISSEDARKKAIQPWFKGQGEKAAKAHVKQMNLDDFLDQ